MTNTEWLCLRLAAKIDTNAGFKADDDYNKLRQMPGELGQHTLDSYRRQRKEAHTKKMLGKAEAIMEWVLREIGGAA